MPENFQGSRVDINITRSPNVTVAVPPGSARGSPLEIFLVFLRLGLTSFGGPISHLGYFRQEFVERRKWLTEETFTDLVALCNFLPGRTITMSPDSELFDRQEHRIAAPARKRLVGAQLHERVDRLAGTIDCIGL